MAEADKDSPAEIESHARQISQTARETTGALDEIVWAINPANDTLEGLANYACKHAQEYFALAGLRCRADVPPQLPAVPIPPDVRHNVFLAFKEAVHNIVKHAQATEARIRLRLELDGFILEVEDNGCGMSNMDSQANPERFAQHEEAVGRHPRRILDWPGGGERNHSAADSACIKAFLIVILIVILNRFGMRESDYD